jgi:glycosyltransferase involved in cell wall biosynthesis
MSDLPCQTIMGTAPIVTAVIPTRNRPELVARAVWSALGQTVSEIEVVVIIDGPDQATERALVDIDDNRLRIISLSAPVGGAEARNCGARAARGNWIALLDDDDEWLPDKIEKQLGAAESAWNSKVLVCSRMIARLPGVDYEWPLRLPRPDEPMSEYLFCRSGFGFGEGFLQTSSFFSSRQMFLDVPFRKGQQRFQDTDWILRVCAQPDVRLTVLPEPLVVYYVDGQRDSVSRKPDWAYLYKWACENRNLFTPRALSFFVATQCVPRAATQKEPFRVWLQLVRTCAFEGAPTGWCLLLCVVFWLVPEDLRHKLRDRLRSAKLRSSKTSPVTAMMKHWLL